MSETQTTQQTPETPPEPVPQHVLQNEENEDATQPLAQLQPQATDAQADGDAEPEAKAKPEIDEAEKARREERRNFARRHGQMVRLRFEEKARADAAEAQLRDILARQNGHQVQPQPFTQEHFDAAVNERAKQQASEMVREWQSTQTVHAWTEAGNKEFDGKFSDACRTLAEQAAPEQRRRLLEVAMDTEGGQRALMQLAEDPEEFGRILEMKQHQMGVALARLAAPPPAPEPVKKTPSLPAPIRPPAGGRARGAPDPERGSFQDFERWSETIPWRR